MIKVAYDRMHLYISIAYLCSRKDEALFNLVLKGKGGFKKRKLVINSLALSSHADLRGLIEKIKVVLGTY